MLKQLLAIKQRREHSARIRLLAAREQKKNCDDNRQSLHQEQQILRQKWSADSLKSQHVDEFQLVKVKRHFSDYYAQDNVLSDKIDAEIKRGHELESMCTEQATALKRAQVQQEKFVFLLEDK